MDQLLWLGQFCSALTTVAAGAMLLIRPLREAATGTRHLRDGLKCLLRSKMLGTYYRNREAAAIRQYEYENFLYEYRAYRALGGNSFLEKIYHEVSQWDVIT